MLGNIYDWYKIPLPNIVMPISWYPRNFTNPDLNKNIIRNKKKSMLEKHSFCFKKSEFNKKHNQKNQKNKFELITCLCSIIKIYVCVLSKHIALTSTVISPNIFTIFGYIIIGSPSFIRTPSRPNNIINSKHITASNHVRNARTLS
uniref:F54D1.6-like second Ig-like domain-containing protein n=1 Tax=Meloidogyne incognita TaxID=6306 RepID=A0A914NUB0_MELIC